MCGYPYVDDLNVNIQKTFSGSSACGGEIDTERVYGKIRRMGKLLAGIIDQYSTDLTQEAREGKLDPVIGREKEIARVMEILSRRTKE